MTPALLESLRVLGYAARQVEAQGLPLSLARAVETLITELNEALPVGTLAEEPIRLRLVRHGPSAEDIAFVRAIVQAGGRCSVLDCKKCPEPDLCIGIADEDDQDAEPKVLERARSWLAEYAKE